MHLDGLVELGEFDLLEKGNRFFELIGARFYLLSGASYAYLSYVPYLLIGADGCLLTHSSLPLSFLWDSIRITQLPNQLQSVKKRRASTNSFRAIGSGLHPPFFSVERVSGCTAASHRPAPRDHEIQSASLQVAESQENFRVYSATIRPLRKRRRLTRSRQLRRNRPCDPF